MRLNGLLERIEYTKVQGDLDINIKDIQHNSKLVSEGSLFVCLEGNKIDGHMFVGEALDNGAAAVIVSKSIEVKNTDVPVLQVEDARIALACIANKYFNYPTTQFSLVGVTGTKRKTITVVLIDKMLRAYGKKTGVINGYGTKIVDEKVVTRKVVPDPLNLQEIFFNMKESNVNNVVMEVHASDLDMKRVASIEFDVAVFTLLTEDGLGVLESREAHRKAKLNLFDVARDAVINIDSEDGLYLIDHSKQEKLLTYGCQNKDADLFATDIVVASHLTSFIVNYLDQQYKVAFPGVAKDLVYSILAALGAAIELGVPVEVAISEMCRADIVNSDLELKGLMVE